MTCEKIYLAYVVYEIINNNRDKIDSIPVRNYGLAKYSFLRVIKSILQSDILGQNLLENPESFVIGDNLPKLKIALEKLFQLVALDINGYIEEYSKDAELFDYKNLFKNKEFCDKLNINILTSNKKSIIRHPEDKFEKIYYSI